MFGVRQPVREDGWERPDVSRPGEDLPPQSPAGEAPSSAELNKRGWCLAADVRGFNVCSCVRSGSSTVSKLVGPLCHRAQLLGAELSQNDLWAQTNLSDQVRSSPG